MRMLVVGAGGTGGYFGGRLLEAGRDVTFLVRPARAEKLARTGLVIQSPLGDATLPAPPTVQAADLREPFDLVLLSCKAYDLADAVASFGPAVGPDTLVLPLLNGMAHLDVLDARFGAGRVLGGYCAISSVLDPQGRIRHLSPLQSLTFGERDGVRTPRALAVQAALAGAGFDLAHSPVILQEMWEKWVFIATLGGITSLMRAAVGDLVQAGSGDLTLQLLEECADCAARQGFPPREAFLQRTRAMLTAPGSPMTASLMRDLEAGGPVEAEAILGDLLGRGSAQGGTYPLLRIVCAHLRAYEARRSRQGLSPS